MRGDHAQVRGYLGAKAMLRSLPAFLLLTVALAPVSGQRPPRIEKVDAFKDPYSKNEPEHLAKLGYVNVGQFVWVGDITTPKLQEILGSDTAIFIETSIHEGEQEPELAHRTMRPTCPVYRVEPRLRGRPHPDFEKYAGVLFSRLERGRCNPARKGRRACAYWYPGRSTPPTTLECRCPCACKSPRLHVRPVCLL